MSSCFSRRRADSGGSLGSRVRNYIRGTRRFDADERDGPLTSADFRQPAPSSGVHPHTTGRLTYQVAVGFVTLSLHSSSESMSSHNGGHNYNIINTGISIIKITIIKRSMG